MHNLNNRNIKKTLTSTLINNLGFFLNLPKYIILHIKSCLLGHALWMWVPYSCRVQSCQVKDLLLQQRSLFTKIYIFIWMSVCYFLCFIGYYTVHKQIKIEYLAYFFFIFQELFFDSSSRESWPKRCWRKQAAERMMTNFWVI